MKYPQLVSMPSEVSDWLEEQLEARGIDAVVYTRYILSLLHRDSADQDLQITQPNKEVRRSGSSRKRFRCFSEWRDYAQVDTEQLRRSAAIECLMSASDQNCGIESLVDELCKKLEKIKSDSIANIESTSSNRSTDLQSISPQDLAKQYYAAFPPLKQNQTSGTSNSIVTLIPKWFTSPKKKGARRQNRSASFDEKLHYKIETDSMKSSRNNVRQRLTYFSKNRNELGYSRSMAKSVERSESMSDWDLFMFANNTKNKLTSNSSDTFGNIIEEKVTSVHDDASGRHSKLEDNKNLWSDEESMNICDDLPVDILDLLDSPSPQDYTVEMMNLANMRDAGSKNFIQCGTNITSSIWSMDAASNDTSNNNSTIFGSNQPELSLDNKFESLTVGNKSIQSIWSNPDVLQNDSSTTEFDNYRKPFENQNYFENTAFNTNNSWNPNFLKKLEKWSEGGECFDNDNYWQSVAKSLLKLNHNKEESCFKEVLPKSGSNAFYLFNKASTVMEILTQSKQSNTETEEENLLTSMRSHFRPINSVQSSSHVSTQKKYADGTSFVISCSLDNPKYKRSESGSLYLESELGSPKKLLEYNTRDSSQPALILKFFVRQNDKACQTDLDMTRDLVMDNAQEVPCKKRVVSESDEFFFPGDDELLKDLPGSTKCTCQENITKSAMSKDKSNDDMLPCPLHHERPNSVLAEMWNDDSKQCEKCNEKNRVWNNDWVKSASAESIWDLDKNSGKSIWNGGEVCSACLGLNNGRPPLSTHQSKLRDDISQDGEQLLSDLSTLQKSYMEQLPATEVSYDISELITGNTERKRRHSPFLETSKNAIPVHRGSWSLSSHMRQDHFMQVTSIPVLHSLTL